MSITSTYLTTSSVETVFESSGQSVVTSMYFCNTSGGNATIDIYVVNDSSIVASAENQLYKNLPVGSGNTYVMSVDRLMLDDLNQIRVAANVGNAITATISTYAV